MVYSKHISLCKKMKLINMYAFCVYCVIVLILCRWVGESQLETEGGLVNSYREVFCKVWY